ncbi:carbohydrate ABC transporter permease [Paenibacillus arenilitoris]|nr:sugar ABC transporter permease [Paenibacillus arenilitoris]
MNKMTRQFEGYSFIGLWIIGFMAFSLGPLLFSLIISFFKWSLLDKPVFIGLKNYIDMFKLDPLFWKSLKVTFTYAVVSVPLGLIVSLLLAILLNLKLKGMGIFRTLFYLPSVITGVAAAVLWMWVLQPDFGILNYFLSFLGIQGPDWLGDPNWALTSLIMMSVWGSGGGIVIFLAGLQNIPQLLYDVSSIDGATKFRQFRAITIPMITPSIFFNLIMGVIGAFRTFTQGYVMTNGGPLNSTYFYALYIYNKAFQDLQMGYAAALSWILFIIIAVLTLLVFKTSSSWVYYETERKG